MATETIQEAAEKANQARKAIGEVVHGQTTAVDLLLVALAARGHTLLEGVPGVGKTTLAKTFARVTGLEFSRIQLTPDLMPSDVTGHYYFDQSTNKFNLRYGPAFTNILLADEINRAPPRTQSALLEVMEERHVSIDGESLPVPDPFLVVATKNPIDIEGVYPLPEAQLDRFMLFIDMKYPSRDVERMMLLGKLRNGSDGPSPVPGLVQALRTGLAEVRVHGDVMDYILDLCRETRRHTDIIQLGAGPRAAEHLQIAARGKALLEGRDFVVPGDVQELAGPVLAHRIILTAEADMQGVTKPEAVDRILDLVQAPLEARTA